MAIIDYNKEIAIDILEKSYTTVELEDETVKVTNEIKLKVCSKENTYYVECYALDVEEEGDSWLSVFFFIDTFAVSVHIEQLEFLFLCFT